MNDEVRAALEIDRSTPMQGRTIDITTTGRRSGEPRRLETVFYRFGDAIYLSGLPGQRPRAWLLNLEAQPRFTFHLKHDVVADLPATATIVTDPAQRRRVMTPFVEDFNARNGPGSGWGDAVLDDWVARSPLVRVSFDAPA
jgi:deazaflavin-dependent oxidoreductase (nitroreductase family)